MLSGHIENDMRMAALMALCFFFTLPGNLLFCNSIQAAKETEVVVDSGYLTINTDNANLDEILKIISQRTGIEITVLTRLSKVRIQFSELPIEAGLKRLLKPYSYSFVYGNSAKESNSIEISQVIIFEELEKGNRNSGGVASSSVSKQLSPGYMERTRQAHSTHETEVLTKEPVFPDAPESVEEEEVEQVRNMMEGQLGAMDTEIQAVMETMNAAGWQDQDSMAAAVQKLRKELSTTKTPLPSE